MTKNYKKYRSKILSERKLNIDLEAPIPPTKRQLEFIEDIETYTGVEFTGTTLEEASKYIDENIEDYYLIRQEDEEYF